MPFNTINQHINIQTGLHTGADILGALQRDPAGALLRLLFHQGDYLVMISNNRVD